MNLLELIAEGQNAKLKRRKAEAEHAFQAAEMAKFQTAEMEAKLATMKIRQKLWKEVGEPKVQSFLDQTTEAEASQAQNAQAQTDLGAESSSEMRGAISSSMPQIKQSPELTTLLSSMAPVLMQMAGAGGDVGEFGAVGKLAATGESLAKTRAINDLLKNRVNLTPGIKPAATGGDGNDLASIIKLAGEGDPQAIAAITDENVMRGLAGIEKIVPQLVGLAKPDIDPRSVKDPETGEKITAAFNKKSGDFIRDKDGKVKKFAVEDFPEYEQVKVTTSQGEFTHFVPKKDLGKLVGQGLQTSPAKINWRQIEGSGGSGNITAVPEFAAPGTVIPTSPEKGETAEKSGKFTLAKMGIDSVNKLASLIIRPDGTINREVVAKYQAPIPIGKGREIDSNLRAAIESPIRAASGAALSKEDLGTYKIMYGPSILDSDELIINKLERLHEFNVSYQKQIDPTGSMSKRLGEKPSFAKNKESPKTETAPPMAKLKEGINTEFSNGQVWTLRKGIQTRIK